MIFAAFGLLLPYVSPSEDEKAWIVGVLAAIVFLPAAIYCFGFWRMGDDYVRIDNSTISYVPRRGNPVRLSWTDIHNIRERNYMQRLELYNARGLKVMNLEYQLEGFDRLRQLILEGASHLKGKYIRQREFHKTNVVHGILIFSLADIFAL